MPAPGQARQTLTEGVRYLVPTVAGRNRLLRLHNPNPLHRKLLGRNTGRMRRHPHRRDLTLRHLQGIGHHCAAHLQGRMPRPVLRAHRCQKRHPAQITAHGRPGSVGKHRRLPIIPNTVTHETAQLVAELHIRERSTAQLPVVLRIIGRTHTGAQHGG